MKKNTTFYESIVNELFKMLDEVDSKDTKQSQDKCHEDCHQSDCDCEHCHDENESVLNELFKMLDEVDSNYTKQSQDKCNKDCNHGDCDYEPNFEVLKYTDEDFKDTKKVEDYVDELSKLSVAFKSMPETHQAIVKIFFNNTDVVPYIDALIEHAYHVHHVSIKREEQKSKEEAEKKQNASFSSQTKELAERYVDEVYVKTFNKIGINVSKSQISELKKSFTDFADWILKQ